MLKQITLLTLSLIILFSNSILAQEKKEDWVGWRSGGGLGLDLAQMLFINPKVGAGENRIGIGGNTNYFAKYKKGRISWRNNGVISFGVQKLGSGTKPFQKNIDELRISSVFFCAVSTDNPFSYALDATFLSQITPTYEGNYLSYRDGAVVQHAISKFFAPATVVVSPGIAYKPNENFSVLLSPASVKSIFVANDSIAMLGNADRNASMHGNPFGGTDAEAFKKKWKVAPSGMTPDSVYYAKSFLQLGTTLKASYQNKFLKDENGKARIAFASSLTLYSNYLKDPQFIDVEWTTTTDFIIFKGLSISLGTNLFYDHDVLVQINADKDPNTGVNGYEATGRRVSFTETLLIKYNFLF